MGGPLIASFDKGDVRMSPGGLTVYGDDELYEIKLGVKGEDGRDGRVNTFYGAIGGATGRSPPTVLGEWPPWKCSWRSKSPAGHARKPFSRHQVPTID